MLLTYESAMLPGMCVAPAPSEAQLEFKNGAGRDLKERIVLFNWTAVGWCQGRIRRPSGDKNKMVKVNGIRQPANFIVAWDDGEGPACLTAGKYGQGEQRESERWVLLQSVEE